MKRLFFWMWGGGLALATAAVANDWSQWRGPERVGVSREHNLPEKWTLEGENVLWTSNIGGRSTPIVFNGRVFNNGKSPHDINDPKTKILAQDIVYCRDANTGKVLWENALNLFQTDIPGPRVGWAAMAGDMETGYVYVHTVSGLLVCYDRDGKLIWQHSLQEEYGEITGYGGRVHTPIIDENRVVISALASGWGIYKGPAPVHLYIAFDKRTGEVIWESAPGGAPTDTTYTCPTVAVVNGVRMIIGGNADGGVAAMKARTGEKIWNFGMSKRGLNASVVVSGNYVYASHGEDNIDTTAFGRVQCIDATGKGDITKSHSVWRIDGLKAGYASPALQDGILYVVSDFGKVHAIDAKTGKELWTHVLGTVGKGSPVWADGKLYVGEVNGKIHILKPSRDKCESLSMVHLPAIGAEGDDEIYGSPAVADGKVYFVSRDRTICIGLKGAKAESAPIPPMPPEKKSTGKLAALQLVPAEIWVHAGESIKFTLSGFDENGVALGKVDAPLKVEGLTGATVDKMTVATVKGGKELGGAVTAEVDGVKTLARVRVFPPLPWKWTFEGFKEKQVPPTWMQAFIKLQPTDVKGDMTLKNAGGGKGKPSGVIYMGPPDMKDYVIQADVMGKDVKRRMPNLGIVANRYTLRLMGNTQQVQIESWEPHLRMNSSKSFRWDPDVWYVMKLRVDVKDGKGYVRGKVWKRGEAEPSEWTIEAVDPHPNENGAPGLYYYSLSDSFFDNVIVSESKS